jgi:hypothetical protein
MRSDGHDGSLRNRSVRGTSLGPVAAAVVCAGGMIIGAGCPVAGAVEVEGSSAGSGFKEPVPDLVVGAIL